MCVRGDQEGEILVRDVALAGGILGAAGGGEIGISSAGSWVVSGDWRVVWSE